MEFDEESLRGTEMGEAASIVAAMPEVRASLVRLQRDFDPGDYRTKVEGAEELYTSSLAARVPSHAP